MLLLPIDHRVRDEASAFFVDVTIDHDTELPLHIPRMHSVPVLAPTNQRSIPVLGLVIFFFAIAVLALPAERFLDVTVQLCRRERTTQLLDLGRRRLQRLGVGVRVAPVEVLDVFSPAEVRLEIVEGQRGERLAVLEDIFGRGPCPMALAAQPFPRQHALRLRCVMSRCWQLLRRVVPL